MREKKTDTYGSVGAQRSTMDRSARGGLASMSAATPIIAASKGSCPEWFPMRRTRPAGRFSSPRVSTRK